MYFKHYLDAQLETRVVKIEPNRKIIRIKQKC